jgi:SAM-dependent methyltransferase
MLISVQTRTVPVFAWELKIDGSADILCLWFVAEFVIPVLVLNWLFYRPIFGKTQERGEGNPWQEYWGETYAPELKQRLLKPLFDELDRAGKVGNLVIDIGSGARPVSRLLEAKPGRKRICVDIAADNSQSADELRLRLDAEKVGQFERLSFRKASLLACTFLGISPRKDQETERAEAIVISDTLNYVDFRRVLSGFAKFLKPNGRFIILNLPYRGNHALFSERGLKDNHQLYAFLEEQHFEIEHKAFPKRPRNETDESEELIVLVARKEQQRSVGAQSL